MPWRSRLPIRALDLRGEVIVPAFTFIATAHALQWQQITPVFADVDPQTHLIDPSSAACLVTPRTSAILGVHTWGRCCDVEALSRLAARHRLHLLFDAAHAFGCGQDGRLVGSFGELEVFSFHATKFVNSLEGGAIVTNNDELAQKMRLMKNFGFLGYDNVGTIGTNGKMNEFSAAMGITSIESMDAFVTANRRNYERYTEELSAVPGVRVLPVQTGAAIATINTWSPKSIRRSVRSLATGCSTCCGLRTSWRAVTSIPDVTGCSRIAR